MDPSSILDFSKPLEISLFDQIVSAFYDRGSIDANKLLVQFQEHPQSWTRVAELLEKSSNPKTKLLGLNILSNLVQYKWNALPQPQKDGIKNYLVGLIIKLSENPEIMKQNQVVLGKLNLCLVQLLKHEWPHNWPNFVTDLVNSSKRSQSLCANNMNILMQLSEEVFDFSSGQMTQDKIKTMKTGLSKEFTQIYHLCEYVLENSQDIPLLTATLSTLLRFITWIPVGFIFETKLIQTLCLKFFPADVFQNDTLRILAEIGALKLPDHKQYDPIFAKMYASVIEPTNKLLPPSTDIAKLYASGNKRAEAFIRFLTVFITGFLRSHLDLLESGDDESKNSLGASLMLLLRISRVDDPDIFKICLEYWSHLVNDLFNTCRHQTRAVGMFGAVSGAQDVPPRLRLYRDVLSKLRWVMISRMAKPEEVLIVEDEHGEIVRESMRDTDSITLYKNMRECLIFLTHLDPQDTETIMIDKLNKQVDDTEYSWNNLNTLCWAVGSISGALSELQEKTFLVRVIKDLLKLCDLKRGKDHKAVIASNIMYVVGQYPRFLRNHWRFLKTVINKLFEFMHEKHPGVQDMSCDTFLKIAKKCRSEFTAHQKDEHRPFVMDVIDQLPEHIRDLEQSQIHTFYEAMGEIIQAEQDVSKQQRLVLELMKLPNQTWVQIVQQANQNVDVLWDLKTVKAVVLVLKTNNRVASALGHGFTVQITRIYIEMLQIYKLYSGYISKAIATHGPGETKKVLIRQMRAVKKETLKLIQTFLEHCRDQDKELVFSKFLPPLMDPVLDDYARGVPDAREPEVLMLFAAFINKLQLMMVPGVPRIFESVFQCTLEMINKNLQDYPDHRSAFFKLLRSINKSAFPALLRFNMAQFQLIMDSIIWAVKHLERNIAETGLTILLELLKNVQTSEVANDFFKAYFLSLLQDLFGVLTDTFHKPGFALHANLLATLFNIIETSVITVPLWTAGGPQFPNNQTFVFESVVALLLRAFPHIGQPQTRAFVQSLFVTSSNLTAFKTHLRDFLVQLKEFSAHDNSDLFLEEQQRKQQEEAKRQQEYVASVPGLQYVAPELRSGGAQAGATQDMA